MVNLEQVLSDKGNKFRKDMMKCRNVEGTEVQGFDGQFQEFQYTTAWTSGFSTLAG